MRLATPPDLSCPASIVGRAAEPDANSLAAARPLPHRNTHEIPQSRPDYKGWAGFSANSVKNRWMLWVSRGHRTGYRTPATHTPQPRSSGGQEPSTPPDKGFVRVRPTPARDAAPRAGRAGWTQTPRAATGTVPARNRRGRRSRAPLAGSPRLHRLLVDRHVVHVQELLLVEDHLLT